jgi:hypothetical protein
MSSWVAGQATFSVRAGAAGTSSYTAKTPTASVGLDITYSAVRACCRASRKAQLKWDEGSPYQNCLADFPMLFGTSPQIQGMITFPLLRERHLLGDDDLSQRAEQHLVS